MSKALSWHYSDVKMSAMASKPPAPRLFTQPFVQAQIKENTKAPRHWPFMRGIHRWPANSSHKGPAKRKMFPFDDVIMTRNCRSWSTNVRIPLTRPQKFEWPVWHCPLIYWPGNSRRPCVIFVPQMNVIHEIGDVTAHWLNDLEDIGQGQRSLRATHPLMLVIICAK